MEFEFDPNKSASNKIKHGIDFVEAQALWDDPDICRYPSNRTYELRWMITGKFNDKHWSAVVTYRTDKIRIISVRRARTEEIEIYEKRKVD